MKAPEILKSEGFVNIYQWHDQPNTKYSAHTHKGEVTIFVEKGDVTFHFSDNTMHIVNFGQRFDVPIGLEHSAIVGSNGCDYVVGEMIEGDS